MALQLLFPELAEAHPPGVSSPTVVFHLHRLKWMMLVGGEPIVKRACDVVCTLLFIPLLGPVALLAALLIKLTDGGPVFFWQKRVGRHGRQFDFPKLRSMVVDAAEQRGQLEGKNKHGRGITFKMRQDPRITSVGRVIRRLSIDELPQLWCVLVGDMTLVGPRPALPSEVVRYSQAERRRLDVTPGLTCLWQVSGRADLPFEKQVHLDVSYIEERSLWMDLSILVKTVPAVLTGRGAY